MPLARRIASLIEKETRSDQLGAAALNLTTISRRINPTEAEKALRRGHADTECRTQQHGSSGTRTGCSGFGIAFCSAWPG